MNGLSSFVSIIVCWPREGELFSFYFLAVLDFRDMRLSSYALIDLRQRERVIDWLSQRSKHNKLFVSEGPIKPHVTKIEESKNIRKTYYHSLALHI